MKTLAKKLAKNLTAGDVVETPSAERKWLKSPLTVLSVEEGRSDARGVWLNVRASFVSPYSGEVSESIFNYRPTTAIRLVG